MSAATTRQRPRAEPAAAQRRVRIGRIVALIMVGALVAAGCLLVAAPAEPFIMLAGHNLERRQHDKALYWLRQAEELFPNNAEVQFLLARTYRRLENFDKTSRHLRQARSLGYSQWHLEREQLIALAQTGQYDAVQQHWGMLLSTAGSDVPEISNAYVLDRLSKFNLQEAVIVLDAWMLDFPQDPQPHYLRGKVWEVLERTPQA
jgi:tetratricopeptide (TPR) repeat protein